MSRTATEAAADSRVAVASTPATSWLQEARVYLARVGEFDATDWLCYGLWIGTCASLLAGVGAFVALGWAAGIEWPGYVYLIVAGTALFVVALAIDTIGHRTVYKRELASGEATVHHMIVGTAVPSVMALCLCYQHAATFRWPALGLIALSFFYSAIDEAMHWRRYLRDGVDRIEAWCHFFAIIGHVVMITSWWQWVDAGYPGVAQTLAALGSYTTGSR